MLKFYLLLGVVISSVGANFLYQAFRFAPEWSVAVERSWFQIVALASLAAAYAVASINHQL